MLLEDNSVAIRDKRGGRRNRLYRTQVAGVLAAAFSLSLAYSVIVTFTGSHEGYGMADPDLGAFYAVGFELVAMVLSDRTWAWWVVAVVVFENPVTGERKPSPRTYRLRLLRRRTHGSSRTCTAGRGRRLGPAQSPVP